MFVQALMIIACTATPVKAPPEQSDAAPGHQNLALDLDNCKREIVEVINEADPKAQFDPTKPSWMRVGAIVAMGWERRNPGWYIYRMKGPNEKGEFPKGCPVTIKCPYEGHNI
jgi:hypothetical protein